MHFSAETRKIKEIYPKNVLIFRENETLDIALILKNLLHFLVFQETKTPKNFLTFYQKKAFLIFRKTESLKKFLIFQEKELSYISGQGDLNYFLYFKN